MSDYDTDSDSDSKSFLGWFLGVVLVLMVVIWGVCSVVERAGKSAVARAPGPTPVAEKLSGTPASVCIQTDSRGDKDIWERDGGTGQKVGTLFEGSRADTIRESATAYLITSPRDGSVGWINKKYVTGVVKESPCLDGGVGSGSSGPTCVDGIRCGNTCIARNKKCHK
jgi:hypothetical protein